MEITTKQKKSPLKSGSSMRDFMDMKAGEIREFKLEESNWNSYRTRASELNRKAGYTKYSVSVDRLTKILRIIHNG